MKRDVLKRFFFYKRGSSRGWTYLVYEGIAQAGSPMSPHRCQRFWTLYYSAPDTSAPVLLNLIMEDELL